MRLSRRDFLKLVGAVGIASTIPTSTIQKALAGNTDPRVIWLQGQSCSGCSVSLMNCIDTTTIDDLLINHLNLEYHSTLMAGAGDIAFSGAVGPHPSVGELTAFSDEWLATGDNLQFDIDGPAQQPDGKVNLIDFAALCKQGYILVVEGSIPMDHDGKFCSVGGEMTMTDAFSLLGSKADMIIAIGTCACYGGIPGAVDLVSHTNPTGAKSVTSAMSALGVSKPVIKIPGCPTHPEWFVGTVVKLLAGEPVELDSQMRPKDLFGDSGDVSQRVHAKCPFKGSGVEDAHNLGEYGCLEDVGCRGKSTWANCPTLKWNGGVSWCVQTRTPCHGCTESNFPGTEPLIKYGN